MMQVALSAQNQAKTLPLKSAPAAPEIRYVTFSTFSWEHDVEKIKVFLSVSKLIILRTDLSVK
jgi:hypothetical protein